METEVRFYCWRVTRELTLWPVGTISHQTDSSLGDVLAPPQSVPGHTREDALADAGGSTDAQGVHKDSKSNLRNRLVAGSDSSGESEVSGDYHSVLYHLTRLWFYFVGIHLGWHGRYDRHSSQLVGTRRAVQQGHEHSRGLRGSSFSASVSIC